MPTATLTSKGQITLPKPVRDHLHVGDGDRVDFNIAADGSVVLHRVGGGVASLAGLLHKPSRKTVSLAQMDEAITSAATEKAGRRP